MEFLIKIGCILLIVFISHSCSMQDSLLVRKELNSNTEIRTDGYYYRISETTMISFFLYESGEYLDMGGHYNCKKTRCHEEHIEKSTDNKNNYNNIYSDKASWGVYEILTNQIIIRSYFPIGLGSYSIRTKEGVIKSDSVILIQSINDVPLKEVRVYKFHAYSPKPDSTNNFIN